MISIKSDQYRWHVVVQCNGCGVTKNISTVQSLLSYVRDLNKMEDEHARCR